ncbi:hypothetical protein FBQ97_11360 [Acidobacteria bacterium ACD]|nr:MAG: hypothetical protein EDX89_21355 [Acidobacteriota bacterium]MCE7956638.1 hypothetical protein [Acidobacteria bacterium ACB2]MDL1950397.1 hypothetical protein [Acidobacteria bacterium ACD]
MRKSVIGHPAAAPSADAGPFLDLERLARVEVSSEDPAHPVESALLPGRSGGWRAAGPGPQLVRIVFDEPQRVRRVRLVVEEHLVERTQELALFWSPSEAEAPRALLRQQYTFSPGGAKREVEDYAFDLNGVKVLALELVADIRGGGTRASIASLQVG